MSNFIVPLSSLPPVSSIADKAAGQAASAGSSVPFSNILQTAVDNMAQAGAQSQESMYNLAMNSSDDLHSGAIDMLKNTTAISYTSSVVNAAIRAYNELIRMQI